MLRPEAGLDGIAPYPDLYSAFFTDVDPMVVHDSSNS